LGGIGKTFLYSIVFQIPVNAALARIHHLFLKGEENAFLKFKILSKISILKFI